MPVVTTPQANAPRTCPYILAQSAVPVILAPNGTVAANGAITLGTALPTTYSGGAWVRLPAGAVAGGLAGLYWTTFSSTTVGAVTSLFVDPATAFTPYLPTVALVAAVGSAVAYTQTTAADITLANVTVPGGAMGPNGALRISDWWGANNTAGAKTIAVKLSASAIKTTGSLANTNSIGMFAHTSNRGTASQHTRVGSAAPWGAASAPPIYTTINTAIDQTLTFTGQLATATDYIVLEAATIEVLPS